MEHSFNAAYNFEANLHSSLKILKHIIIREFAERNAEDQKSCCYLSRITATD